ncbi:uncharacterized protein ARMOST_17239 [Armillaria ostoyae]|uniref:Uncharacterized protein n=1 Tax=Armillaria ostoyae TaxID=47428 RepID=A0A284RYF4_ARMOS|nr:uncharacterized protein ARMOST_17239 [Armillaria ostoyae]
MPFDGCLFTSHVMVAKEAHTSPSVKDLIVAAPGVDDDTWEGTYDKSAGGILTVRSELGEPIHKVATRAIKLWGEFDDTVFGLPKEKCAAWLNKDFSKPWFGWKKDGSVARALSDMTYEEVSLRMVHLMFVSHQSRWADPSSRNLTGDWLRRIEKHFAGVNGESNKPSVLQSYTSLDDPLPFIQSFFQTCVGGTTQLSAAEDSAFFLAISQRHGQKPVPFIPVLDASFEVWFKKDSLWAAEDIEAVFDQDPQRVRILQGPVAVKHSKVKDEPIKDLLGNINSSHIQLPVIDYLAPRPSTTVACPNVKISEASGRRVYEFGSSLPSPSVWFETLAGPQLSWLRALVTSPTIVQGSEYIDNPMRHLLVPQANQKVVVSSSSVSIYGAAHSFGEHKSEFNAIEIKFDEASKLIDVTLFEDRQDSSVSLFAVQEFYWKLWFGDDSSLPELDVSDVFTGPEVVIEAVSVKQFYAVVGNQTESFKTARKDMITAPMDFAIVTGRQVSRAALSPKCAVEMQNLEWSLVAVSSLIVLSDYGALTHQPSIILFVKTLSEAASQQRLKQLQPIVWKCLVWVFSLVLDIWCLT